MTNTELEKYAKLIFGDCWQLPLSKALNVHKNTIRAWKNGTFAMPGQTRPHGRHRINDLKKPIKKMLEKRKKEIDDAIKQLYFKEHEQDN